MSTKLSISSPAEHLLWQEGALLGALRLGSCDTIDDKANAALGNDVGDAVAHLDGHNCMGAAEADHWEDVDNWVGQPADHGPILGALNHLLDHWVGLAVCGCSHTDKQLVDNVEEWAKGRSPVKPADAQVAVNKQLAWVADADHQARRHTKGNGLVPDLIVWELHDEDDLDEQKWHCQQPIHVAVGIVEWNTCQHWILNLAAAVWLVLISLNPGVEDTQVVVGRDKSHHARDDQSTLILILHSRHAHPQEQCGGHHGCQGEGQDVVDKPELGV